MLLFAIPFICWSQSDFTVVFDESPATIGCGSRKASVQTDSLRTKIIASARKYIGVSYRYSQSNENGFDCSGYVRYIYRNFGFDLPRSSSDQYKQSRRVRENEVLPGDLVFFKTRGKSISHVGIYLGNHEFIHSPSKGKSVSISKLNEAYYKKHLVGFGSYITRF